MENASPAICAIGVTTTSLRAAISAYGREGSLLFPIDLRLGIGTVKGNFVNIHLLVWPDDPQP